MEMICLRMETLPPTCPSSQVLKEMTKYLLIMINSRDEINSCKCTLPLPPYVGDRGYNLQIQVLLSEENIVPFYSVSTRDAPSSCVEVLVDFGEHCSTLGGDEVHAIAQLRFATKMKICFQFRMLVWTRNIASIEAINLQGIDMLFLTLFFFASLRLTLTMLA